MDQAEQARATRAVGRALLAVAPPEWTSIRAEYRSAGRHIEVDVFVAGPDRVPRPVRPPMEVVEGLGRLRAGMYQPGRGTWLSAVYALEPPSSFSVDFEPDAEPRWRRLPPPIGFQDELRFFPRTDENIPPWFRHRAGLPTPTPPSGTPVPPSAAAPVPTPPSGAPIQHQSAPGQPPTPPAGTPGFAQPTPPPGNSALPEAPLPQPTARSWTPPPPADPPAN